MRFYTLGSLVWFYDKLVYCCIFLCGKFISYPKSLWEKLFESCKHNSFITVTIQVKNFVGILNTLWFIRSLYNLCTVITMISNCKGTIWWCYKTQRISYSLCIFSTDQSVGQYLGIRIVLCMRIKQFSYYKIAKMVCHQYNFPAGTKYLVTFCLLLLTVCAWEI